MKRQREEEEETEEEKSLEESEIDLSEKGIKKSLELFREQEWELVTSPGTIGLPQEMFLNCPKKEKKKSNNLDEFISSFFSVKLWKFVLSSLNSRLEDAKATGSLTKFGSLL